MSLAIGVVQKDFIIASSDSALTMFSCDEEKYEKTGEIVMKEEPIRSEVKSEKVLKLTNKVLLTNCGNLVLTELIISELKYFVKDDYDLKKCSAIAKKVISNIQQGVFLNKDNLFNSLTENYKITSFQLWEMKSDFKTYIDDLLSGAERGNNLIRGYSMYLLGFNEDGTTGLMDVRIGSYTSGPTDIKKGYPVILEGPDSREYLQFLNLPIEERTFEGFANRMSLVHARISKDNQVNVSSDCSYNVLMRNGDFIDYSKFSIDTLELQKAFN